MRVIKREVWIMASVCLYGVSQISPAAIRAIWPIGHSDSLLYIAGHTVSCLTTRPNGHSLCTLTFSG